MKGVLGFVITMIAPYLTFLETGTRLLAGTGGLILLVYSIMHKRMQIKYEKEKLKKLNDE